MEHEPGPTLVLVAGFLGAGKTSLIARAAGILLRAGRRVAAIANDQGDDLVDSALLREQGIATDEVTGGCFCCRLSNLVAAAGRLLAAAPDVIFAEPVGSCADLAATVVRPLRRIFGSRLTIAPITVLVDPRRCIEMRAAGADRRLAYLFEKQMAEADLVCYSKADLENEARPGQARRLSAHTGQGVAEWLEDVLSPGQDSGGILLDLDYARYTEAEAALAWYDLSATLHLDRALTPAAVAGPLLNSIAVSLSAREIAIGHLKIMDIAAGGYIRASVCRENEAPAVEGSLDAPPSAVHRLTLNLRAACSPLALQKAAWRALAGLPGSLDLARQRSFSPPPPAPEIRIAERL